MKTKHYYVYGMVCFSCAAILEEVVKSVHGVAGASVDYVADQLTVRYTKELDFGTLKKAAVRAGFRLVEAESGDISALKRMKNRKKKMLRRKIFLAFAVSVILNLPVDLNTWLQLVLGSVSQGIIMSEYCREAVAGIETGKSNMSVLIIISTISAYIYSVAAIFVKEAMYPCFNSTAAVIMILLIGRFIELGTRTESVEELVKLKAYQLQEVLVVSGSSMVKQKISEIQVGDSIVIKDGDRIPLDAVISSGGISVDEANITGEYYPVEKKAGDEIIGGTYAIRGYAVCTVIRELENNYYNRIINDAIISAGGKRMKILSRTDTVLRYFVPAVIAVAVATLFIHYGFIDPGNLHRATMNAIAVMLVACPCALGMATPIAVTNAILCALRKGVSIKDEEKFADLSRANTIVFDKTGTLSESKLYVSGSTIDAKQQTGLTLLACIGSIETLSSHPVATAVVEYCDSVHAAKYSVEDFEALPAGVRGICRGEKVFVGTKEFVEDAVNRKIDIERKARVKQVFFSVGNDCGAFELIEKLRDDAYAAVKRLKENGLKVMIISGDTQENTAYVGEDLCVNNMQGNVRPEEKKRMIEELEGKIIMVGDGLNDLPGMTASVVSIAMGSGSEYLSAYADITIGRDNIGVIPELISLSALMNRTISLNLIWAMVYNIVGIILAAAGIISPVAAGYAMSISSIVIVLNSERMKKRAGK